MIIARNSMAALNTAIAYAGLDSYDIFALTAERRGELYELSFRTDFMEYSFFIEADTLEVLGFDSAPVSESENAELRCA